MTKTPSYSCSVTQNKREIPHVPTDLSWADRLGAFKVRWGIGRMNYQVAPGLYAVGEPDSESPVLVSANYKLSFDYLRSRLGGVSDLGIEGVWILVLDTKGINVWCAAGKGTFGTDEIVHRVEAVGLADIVKHRKLIVPQLGAPGVCAHEVKKRSDFKVIYGPVRADDIPAFLEAGMKATDKMRQVTFPLWSRMVLIPVELMMGLRYAIFAALCFFLLGGLHRGGYSSSLAMDRGLTGAILLFSAFGAGCILGPMLLPWLPGRAFALKGLWIGLAMAAGLGYYWWPLPENGVHLVTMGAWLIIIPAVVSFILMNFTGASTFTSLSGVRREMRTAVPLQVAGAVIGVGLYIAGMFF